MTETLLRSLRETMLDESEPLAGLLRKCLLLGAETGSSSLRDWARYELNGYEDGVEVPPNRHVALPAIKMNSISGLTVATGQKVERFQLPAKAIDSIPEVLHLRQPIEELETLASLSTLALTHPSLAYAQAVWNDELDEFQQVTNLYFEMPGAVVVGVLGKIRTQLFDVIADLTADTPLRELPRKEQVDAAVGLRVGTLYNTTISGSSGPVAVGKRASATVEGLSLDDALRLLDVVRDAAQEVADVQLRDDLMEALEDLRAEAEASTPETGQVVKKAGRLKAAAARIGIPALSSAVGGAVEAFTSLAIGDMFG